MWRWESGLLSRPIIKAVLGCLKLCIGVGFYLSGLKSGSVSAGYRVGISLELLSLPDRFPM